MPTASPDESKPAKQTTREEFMDNGSTAQDMHTTAAPLVSPGDSKLLPRRQSRQLYPQSWLRIKSALTYTDGVKVHELTCTPLDTCGAGLVVAANDGAKMLISWDRFVRLELLES